MAQSRRNALRHGTPISDSSDFISCNDKPDSFRKEIFLDYAHWQNISEDRLAWYDYNRSPKDGQGLTAIRHLVIPCIKDIIASGLTERQKQVVTMYFLHDLTQKNIAHKLGISQPTVNQHLKGKLRNGKKIGGSIKRIKKVIHRMSLNANNDYSQVFNILDEILDDKITLRKSHCLIQSMIK